MKIIIKSKTSFNTIEYDNVSSITYASKIFTVTHGGVTSTYSSDDYIIAMVIM